MLTVAQQLSRGALVCPLTREKLIEVDGSLITHGGQLSYRIKHGVPILLAAEGRGDEDDRAAFTAGSTVGPRRLSKIQTAVDKLFNRVGDQRSDASIDAWRRFLSRLGDDDLCVAVGGGPTRPDHRFVNLNIEACENVEVVADAHRLPYSDGSVDAIHCEAILEHLAYPNRAVREMARTLKPGGEVYSVTPFLQGFHGYPNHYFNPTIEGHRLYFLRSGFEIVADGVCVGPSWMISSLMVEYLAMVVPIRGLRASVMLAARFALLPLRFLDRLVNRTKRAHLLASTTFVHARKPDMPSGTNPRTGS